MIPRRNARIDFLRGAAVVGMVVFHVAVFNDHVRSTSWCAHPGMDMTGRVARTIFVFLLGLSISLARRRSKTAAARRRYHLRLLRRTAFIAMGACFVTAATAGNVRFGILHYMTVASLLFGLLPTRWLPAVAFLWCLVAQGAGPPHGPCPR